MAGRIIEPATAADVLIVAANTDPADAAEYLRLAGQPVATVLLAAFERSAERWRLAYGNEVVAVGGGIPVEVGCHLWWAVTPGFRRHPMRAVRAAREIVALLQARFGTVTSVTDPERYGATMKLATHLGFAVAEPIEGLGVTLRLSELKHVVSG